MIDLILFVFLACMALIGWKKGFVKTFFNLGYYVISAVAALLIYPYISKLIINSSLYAFIHDKVILPRLALQTGETNLPSFLQQMLTDSADLAAKSLAVALTETAISIICFAAVFLIVRFGLKFTAGILDKIAHLPVLNIFNRVGGLALGAANSVIIMYIIFAILSVVMNNQLYRFISSSEVALRMYNNNLILKILFG